ncbi:xylitol dehydrogenase [Pseudohyphozyma bogoriensis]|nr:xylitol dehydrogenase [Pseudohyphozyma bogoriensis]
MIATKPDASVPSRNECFVLHGIRDTRFEERPKPKLLKDTETFHQSVIVAPKKTGICGAHIFSDVRVVGSAVKDLQVGDRVALEPGESCRLCHSCKSGRYEQCPDMVFAATPPYDGGTLAGYYMLPGDLCYKLPDSVSLEQGALMEPLSVAVMAVHRIGAMPHNANVVVFGAGPVGLLTMAVAKALGARSVIGVDIQQDRLDFAKEYAATDVYVPGPVKEGEERVEYSRRQAEEMRKKFGFEERGDKGVDLVLDCTGAEVCIQTGIWITKHGGTFVQELTVKGSFRYGPGIYPLAIDLVGRGLINLKPLITHRYTFKEAKEAFHANETGKGADGKAVIKAMIDGPL